MSDLITSQESCTSLAGNNSAFFLDQEQKIPGNPTVKFQKYFRGEKVFPRRKSISEEEITKKQIRIAFVFSRDF
jgi:hypothetical protein